MDSDEDYEERRRRNIEQNEALLRELDLKGAAANLGMPPPRMGKGRGKAKVASKPAGAKPVQARKKAAPKTSAAPAPRRQSARLTHQYADPNETAEEKKKRLADLEAKRKREEEERLEALEIERANKRPRHNDLDLQTLLGEDTSSDEVAALRASLEVACRNPYPRRAAKTESSDEGTKKKDPAIADLKNRLSGLVIRSRAKVTQDRVYSMAYHPETTKDILFFGDKHGQLGIWDALAPPIKSEDDEDEEEDNGEGGQYWRLQPHWPNTSKSSISCIKFNPVDSHSVFTSAYDCTLRSTSFVSGSSTELFSLAASETLLTSFDLPVSGNEIWVSDALGGLSHLDLREGGRVRRQVNIKEKIGCVSVNPAHSHLILTSSNDRSAKIWDSRYIRQIEASTLLEDENAKDRNSAPAVLEADNDIVTEFMSSDIGKDRTLLAEYYHKKSASSAFWDPSGRRILSTSYDNFLRIWDLGMWPSTASSPINPFKPDRRISHDCDTGKWVTVFKAQWSQNPDVPSYFTVGNMKRTSNAQHSLDIFAYNGEPLASLADPSKITAVQAVTASHPSIVERAASGNASGRCVLWGPSEN